MVVLKIKKREKLGKKAKKIREQGLVPGILYGENIAPTPVEVERKALEKAFEEAGTSSLIELQLEGDNYQALIHDIAKDPLSDEIIHVDFYRPSTKKEITAEIPLVFEGEEEVQKASGGNVLREIHELEVKGLAHHLPREIKVDLTVLKNFEDRILVKDLNLPEGVRPLRNGGDIVAILVAPSEEEITEEAAAEETGAEQKEEEKKTSAPKEEEKKEKE
jgi:large subunit ribosomal protein L25